MNILQCLEIAFCFCKKALVLTLGFSPYFAVTLFLLLPLSCTFPVIYRWLLFIYQFEYNENQHFQNFCKASRNLTYIYIYTMWGFLLFLNDDSPSLLEQQHHIPDSNQLTFLIFLEVYIHLGYIFFVPIHSLY